MFGILIDEKHFEFIEEPTTGVEKRPAFCWKSKLLEIRTKKWNENQNTPLEIEPKSIMAHSWWNPTYLLSLSFFAFLVFYPRFPSFGYSLPFKRWYLMVWWTNASLNCILLCDLENRLFLLHLCEWFVRKKEEQKMRKKNSCRDSMFHIHVGINGNLMTFIDYVHWRWCISFAFSFRLRRMESTDGRAWIFFLLFFSSTFQANVFLVQSNGLFASLKWFFLFSVRFYIRQPFDHSFPLTLLFGIRLHTFGFIWTFVLSIFNQHFTCRPFVFFLV